MAATNYALLIQRVRLLASDTPTSNFVPGDTPVGIVSGANTLFKLSKQNLVAGSIFMTYNGIFRSTAGFTILDPVSGYVSISPAPIAANVTPTTPFFFDYFFNWFVDADYKSWIDEATDELSLPEGTDVPMGLYAALAWFAAAKYYTRRASSVAHMYASTGGGAGAQPQTPAQALTKLAAQAEAMAEKKRADYYKRQGQREAPASGTVHYPISSVQSPF